MGNTNGLSRSVSVLAAGALASCYWGGTAPGSAGSPPGDDGNAVGAERPRIELRITGSTMNYDIHREAGSPTRPVEIVLRIEPAASVGSTSPARPALTTGALPPGSRVAIHNRGRILGAGGPGGAGGNGGSGGNPRPCGRDGGKGGDAIALTVDAEVDNRGEILGGGGGGGGSSGCNEAAGGGGGAGSRGGGGGAGATALSKSEEIAFCGQDNEYRSGVAGAPGDFAEGGAGGTSRSSHGGDGGGLGQPGADSRECVPAGGGKGGAAGFAIKRHGYQLTGIADGPYDTGTGAIRGRVR